jgi:pimeloyl-ACP methyl ester carboxylesterase
VLVERLGAERVVIPGAGHTPQRMDAFNEALEDFLRRASSS